MSHPARRSGSRPSRRKREQRAYRLTVATGAGAVATVVSIILAIAGVTPFGLVVLLGILTAVSGYLLSRSLGR
jgi:hypothetical protein